MWNYEFGRVLQMLRHTATQLVENRIQSLVKLNMKPGSVADYDGNSFLVLVLIITNRHTATEHFACEQFQSGNI